MVETPSEKPPRAVILVRSVFYGLGLGGVLGIAIGLAVGWQMPEWWMIPFFVGLIGAGVGAATGFLLGLVLLSVKYPSGRSLSHRIAVAVAASLLVFLSVWSLTGKFPLNPYVLIFIIPAGVGAWFLYPMVLRPARRSTLPSDKSD